MSFDVWVDFNDADRRGEALASSKEGRDLAPGDSVIAGDDEGNRCPATVIQLIADPRFAWIKLDLTRFVGR